MIRAGGRKMEDSSPHPHSIYLLRTMQQQHMTLSAMADQKANMLLGVSSVVLALVVREGTLTGMKPPLLILCMTVFLAALCCLMAVLPSTGPRPPSAGLAPSPNLLFFGVFTEMDEPAFQAEIRNLINSDTAIYAAMARDVYQQGQVLRAKKYRWLRHAYRIFIGGLILTFAALALTLLPGYSQPFSL